MVNPCLTWPLFRFQWSFHVLSSFFRFRRALCYTHVVIQSGALRTRFLALYGKNKENNDFDDKVGPISPSSVFSTYTKESSFWIVKPVRSYHRGSG